MERGPIIAGILALPETAGSALYGMVDVLGATGTLWRELAGEEPGPRLIEPVIVGEGRGLFRCGNGIPVTPDHALDDCRPCDIVILPELWLSPEDDLAGRYEAVLDWVRARHAAGSFIYSACSGAILLAQTGLLHHRPATSHWAYGDLFRRSFPDIDFEAAPNLVFAEQDGRIVTAGGTTSWHDLALHIIARHCGPGEALRIAKVYLLKWHGEGQLPFANLARRQPHADAAVRRAEELLAAQFRDSHAIALAIDGSGLAERTIKRRFRLATGKTMIDYVQGLRIEEAKRQLEATARAIDEIAADVGYENAAFFRRIFRRSTGLLPADYRRMFKPVGQAHGA